jgi:hypothetical protein
VKHQTLPRFWQCFRQLPKEVQELARKNFELLKADPLHPSLHFSDRRDAGVVAGLPATAKSRRWSS